MILNEVVGEEGSRVEDPGGPRQRVAKRVAEIERDIRLTAEDAVRMKSGVGHGSSVQSAKSRDEQRDCSSLKRTDTPAYPGEP